MNKKKIIFATGNANKMREIREILGEDEYEILSMKEAGIQVDVEENGATFEENSLIKSRAIALKAPGAYVLADDSGLEVDALDKEPGVYSARYMGEDTSYDIKNKAIIDRLEGLEKEKRSARFVCAVSCVFPDGSDAVVRGTIEGYIGWEPMGEHGFGYDPIFYLWDKDVSTAAIPPEEKNSISHRGNALRMIKKVMEEHENSCN
ncbi:MAG: RdgB/HAM1 family non-canonical purine NTP pyrophosphatase [Pseudobutyrivibrio sp.]|nr:RdgB/HAM1 family non-canonical purine NTP pyrophosphatase [Pseudobutyrivibrio sp.]